MKINNKSTVYMGARRLDIPLSGDEENARVERKDDVGQVDNSKTNLDQLVLSDEALASLQNSEVVGVQQTPAEPSVDEEVEAAVGRISRLLKGSSFTGGYAQTQALTNLTKEEIRTEPYLNVLL